MTNMMTRRFFIGGSAALGAFGGCRFFKTDSSFRAGDAPRLKFGVISDVHIRWGANADVFVRTLEHFRDSGVDAVMICGDIVDIGLVSDLEVIASSWQKVFPSNLAPDGRKVEKIFVTGNHDWAGHNYGRAVKDKYPDPEIFKANILQPDLKGRWERIFDEPFAPVYMKDVKGYKFVGAHWVKKDCNGHSEDFNDHIRAFYESNAGAFDPALPFFHAQHPHPRNTCYGPWAWGRDNGVTTKILSKYPNAVSFSGHSHYTLTDERSVWQGEFTSIGTASLSYASATAEHCPAPGYENYSGGNPGKTMSRIATNNSRQGMVVSVYDDAISISRREYLSGQSLGGDWVMPLPSAESRPFAYAERAKSFAAPDFAPGAAVTVKKSRGKTRASRKHPSVEKDTYTLTFPAARSTAKCRVYDYEFTFTGSDGKSAVRYLMAPGFHLPFADKRVLADVKCSFVAESLPAAPFKVEVRALSCFRNRGNAIAGRLG